MDTRAEKIRLWLENPPEMKFPVPVNLPKFSKKSFRNYDEMNAWKREYLREIAAQGGLKWKDSRDKDSDDILFLQTKKQNLQK